MIRLKPLALILRTSLTLSAVCALACANESEECRDTESGSNCSESASPDEDDSSVNSSDGTNDDNTGNDNTNTNNDSNSGSGSDSSATSNGGDTTSDDTASGETSEPDEVSGNDVVQRTQIDDAPAGEVVCIGDYESNYPAGPYGVTARQVESAGTTAGDIIAPYPFTLSDGSTVNLGQYYTPGEPNLLLVNVSFGWCPNCKTYDYYLESWYQEYASRGFEVLIDMLEGTTQSYRATTSELASIAADPDPALGSNENPRVPANLNSPISIDPPLPLSLSFDVGMSVADFCFSATFFGEDRDSSGLWDYGAPRSVVIDTSTMEIVGYFWESTAPSALIGVQDLLDEYYP